MAHSYEKWQACRIEYETIGTPVAELSVKYVIGTNSINVRIKRDKWIKFKAIEQAKYILNTEIEYIKHAEKVEQANELMKTLPAYVAIHKEEHRQLSIRNRAEAIAAEARLKLAEQNLALASNLDIFSADENIIAKHNTLVNANKNVDTSRQNDRQGQTNNIQVNNYASMDMAELQRELAELRERAG